MKTAMQAPAKPKETSGRAPATAPPIVHQVLTSPGRPLDRKVRSFLEPRFGHDFSSVRVHTDSRAAESARSVNALAYTAGRDIVFGEGQLAPQKSQGMWLLAHELTHVVQQGGRDARSLQTFSLADARSAHEAAADRAADKVASGGTVCSSSFLAAPGGLLQRVERGTYVSKLGPPAYLKAAVDFYRFWGHPNVQEVSTVDDILEDLDKDTGKIDTFRIVAHGNYEGNMMQLGLTPSLMPTVITRSMADLTTSHEFRARLNERRIFHGSLEDRLRELRKKDEIKSLLEQIGAESDRLDLTSPLAIFLQALIDTWITGAARKPEEEPLQIPQVINEFNRLRLRTYRDLVVAAAPSEKRTKLSESINKLIAAVPGALDPITQGEVNAKAAELAQEGAKNTLKPELSTAISEGANGPYLRRLWRVKGRISSGTHIEIRGCKIGRNDGMMTALRDYFGPAGDKNKPSISAPDLYHYFFSLKARTFTTEQSGERELGKRWRDTNSRLPEAFDDWSRIRGREMLRVVEERTLGEFARRYGQDEYRLGQLNPQVKPDDLNPGEPIWLVARPEVTNLPPELREPQASAPRAFGHLRNTLREGKAFVHMEDLGKFSAPQVLLDDSRKATAIAGWLATQKFDPQGRTADVLSELYRGKSEVFKAAMQNTLVQFLSRTYEKIEDPIFPDDPRYDAHIIRRP